MSDDLHVIRHLERQGSASLVELARALHPDVFDSEDVLRRQHVIDVLRARCSRLVDAHVLLRGYSPTDGEPLYFVREVFTRGEMRGEPVAEADAPPPQLRYAVFFKFGGTLIRPACEEVLSHLQTMVPRAERVKVKALMTSGTGEMQRTIAQRRAEAVVSRLMQMGVAGEAIEVAIEEGGGEQPLGDDVFAVDPPRSAAGQSHRVDIELRMP